MVHIARTNVVIVLQQMFVRTQMVDARVNVATDSGERNALNVSNILPNLFYFTFYSKGKHPHSKWSFRIYLIILTTNSDQDYRF